MRIENSLSKSFVTLVCILWAGYPLQDFVSALFITVGFRSVGENLFPVLIVLSLVLSIGVFLKKLNIGIWLLYIVPAIVFFANIMWHPENKSELMEYEDAFLLYSLPFVFIGFSLDFNKFKDLFYKISLSTVYVIFVYYIILHKGASSTVENERGLMSVAYSLLPHVVFIFCKSFEDKRWYNIIGAILGSFTLISLGNRGVFVALLLFSAAYLLFFREYGKHATLKRFIIVVLGGVVYYFLDVISLFLSLLLGVSGMSSRIVDKLVGGELFTDEARENTTGILLDAIANNPIQGYGLCADRNIAGMYAHNIIVELAVSFGVIVTALLALLFIYTTVKAIKNSDYESRLFCVVLLCCCVKVLITGTFLDDQLLYYMLGFLIRQAYCLNNYISYHDK